MRILDNLQAWERLTVADALESVQFERNEAIGFLHKLSKKYYVRAKGTHNYLEK